MAKSQIELIEVYQDTVDKTKDTVLETIKPNNDFTYRVHKKTGNVIVENIDTVSAIVKYQGKSAALNMANANHKGGGVERGKVAQEECLYRCSNLHKIEDVLYPLQTLELLYSKNVKFIKDFHYNDMTCVESDIITMAAVDLRDEMITTKNYIELTMYKINQIFHIASSYEVDNLILGAFGCGVFKNNPHTVASMFQSALLTQRKNFNNVVFAIINDHNSVDNNYEIFKQVLSC